MGKNKTEKLQQEPFHYRHRNFFVGFFVLLPVLLIPAFLMYSLVTSDILEKWHVLYVKYLSAEGLQKGRAVNLNGISVGHVESVNLCEYGGVVVRMRVRRRYARFIRKNSVARLKQKNFVVGDWEIDLTGGDPVYAGVEDGDTLSGELPVQLEQTVMKVTNLVASFDELVSGIMKGEGLLGRLVQDDTLMDVVENLAKRLDVLMSRADKAVTGADRMVGRLTEFGNRGVAAADTFLVFARNADAAVAVLGKVAGDIDSLIVRMGEFPQGLDEVLDILKRDLLEAEALLMGMQNHWLFKRSVGKARDEIRGKP